MMARRNNLLFIKNRNGQTTGLELAIFIVCLVFALVGMQAYIKRSIQGGLRKSADKVGGQYDPEHTFVNYTTISRSDTTSQSDVFVVRDIVNGDWTNSTTTVTTNLEEQTRTGTEIVGAY